MIFGLPFTIWLYVGLGAAGLAWAVLFIRRQRRVGAERIIKKMKERDNAKARDIRRRVDAGRDERVRSLDDAGYRD